MVEDIEIEVGIPEIDHKVNRLRYYYRNVFSLSQFISIYGLKDFNRREFGFLFEHGNMIRNKSFYSPRHLMDFLHQFYPSNVYVGGVYDKKPTKFNPITKIKWLYRELVFDFDINEYDPTRKDICGCVGKYQQCKICWNFMKEYVVVLKAILKYNFGFKNMKWVFTGGRGFHLYVLDPECKYYSSDVRNSIIRFNDDINIDGAVTIDLKRLVRLPGSIHGRTGKICRIINYDFSPFDVKSIYEV